MSNMVYIFFHMSNVYVILENPFIYENDFDSYPMKTDVKISSMTLGFS